MSAPTIEQEYFCEGCGNVIDASLVGIGGPTDTRLYHRRKLLADTGFCGPIKLRAKDPGSPPDPAAAGGRSHPDSRRKRLALARKIVRFLRSNATDGGSNLTTDEAADRIELWFLRGE